jgi:hypothetical protein
METFIKFMTVSIDDIKKKDKFKWWAYHYETYKHIKTYLECEGDDSRFKTTLKWCKKIYS